MLYPPHYIMDKKTAFPRPGQLLRTLIKASGYRCFLVDIGLDKNLDDLATEAWARQSSIFDIMQGIEDACSKALTEDCGNQWGQFFRYGWLCTRKALQHLVQDVDISSLSQDTAQELFRQQFMLPMLSSFIHLLVSKHNGGDTETWLSSPLQTWLTLTSAKTGIGRQGLLRSLTSALDVDQRTIERWLSGEPTGKISWPYAAKVALIIGKKQEDSAVQFLSGWLLVACALQSLSPALRDELKHDYLLRKQQPWDLQQAMNVMNRAIHRPEMWLTAGSVISLQERIEHLFQEQPLREGALKEALNELQRLINQAPASCQNTWLPLCDWLSARLAALLEDRKTALQLYDSAVSGSWWSNGNNQCLILDEALKYAVGVGDKDAAKSYWDKTFMLGLNEGPKRPLDEQEMRRIAFAFEHCFPTLKAKDRVPPAVECIMRDDAPNLNRKHLANPNQKIKYAEGRTRRTPLMMAVMEGTLEDVMRLIEVGGDPNDFISESGEGPLSWAMRKACGTKDTIIMDYLLSLNLTPETVNRSASTKRETPLKIAIEMANASAVSRLIELGADIERSCGSSPSALCYAMLLFCESLYPNDLTQLKRYLSGKTPADVYDAKEGTVLDVDLAACRQRSLHNQVWSTQNISLFKERPHYSIRPPADHRKVIQILLYSGADANKRYRVNACHVAEWTPTLFAAEVGDLAVFKMLVEHEGENRGDPKLTLTPPCSLECYDALWVAIHHNRRSVVSYLLERGEHWYWCRHSS